MLGFAPIAGLPIAGSKTASSGTAYSLAGAQGSYAITGQAAGLKAARKVAAIQGSYAIGGQAAGLKVGRKVAAVQDSYGVTGFTTTLRVGRHLLAVQGAYTIAGQAAALTKTGSASYSLSGVQGPYAISGHAALLRRSHRLLAVSGSYAIVGKSASFRPAPPNPIPPKSFSRGPNGSLLIKEPGTPDWWGRAVLAINKVIPQSVTNPGSPQIQPHYKSTEPPNPADFEGGVIYYSDIKKFAASNGTTWTLIT